MRPFSLYIHVPFCQHKCPYCDFNTYAVAAIPEREYTSALLAEIDYRASLTEWKSRPVQSIYFGGGTPSLFAPATIDKIITTISQRFPVEDRVEISIEANPGSVTTESLTGYRVAGVNRISFGTQSFNPKTLSNLGRIHTPEQGVLAFQQARAAGFHNINLDLMYGVPNQTLEELKEDLQEIVHLNPEHVSAYGLTIEKGTPFFLSYRKGLLKLPKEQLVISMMEEINSALPFYGWDRYEISNFGKREREARHNLAYWNGDDYLGIGAGAHSYRELRDGGPLAGVRWSNVALPKQYIDECAGTGHATSWKEELARDDAIFEFFFLGLRKIAGVDINEFEARFGQSVKSLYPALLGILGDQDLLKAENDRLYLTERGLMLADSVLENFAETEVPLRSAPAEKLVGNGTSSAER